MKRKHLLVLFSMMLISLLIGCFQFRPITPSYPYTLDEELQMGKYVPKIDNFIIILDSSSSMSVTYEDKADRGYSKFKVAKDVIRRINNTIPEMKINGALQTFGHGIVKPIKQTETVYGLTAYSRSGLEQSLNSVKSPAEGNSPAGLAIEAISNIIVTAKGENAVILISDGENLENDPLMKVRALKNRYGDRTCLYTIWVGNKPEGKTFMEKLAGEMECGFSTSVDEIASSEDMTNFVRKVFLTRYRDSDKDGVLDHLDKCPDTPIGVKVDETGCPKVSRMDSDGDGVYDNRDECPDTPKGAIVDDRGCWVVKGVQFDYKKWDIKSQYNSNLDNVVNILIRNPGLKIRIEGHTDDIGSMKYNLELSQNRAQAIKDYLVGKGVDQSRISITGLGYSQPIAGNDTPEGRALNRRAELIPVR
ncbi:MAG: OmpA family protein [Candidatus Scalinduaceae bacterium]